MCLSIKSGPHIAEEDIPVLKILRNDNRSEYLEFLYKPNTQFTTAIIVNAYREAEDGFHAYVRDRILLVAKVPELYSGNHFVTFGSSGDFATKEHKWVNFTVPKGATYYLGIRGDIVANKIRSGSLNAIRPRDLRRYIKKDK